MASPVGHVLAGQLAYRAGSAGTGARGAALAWLCAFAAIAPDLDFLPGALLGRPALYHQGASHSLVAATGFSLLLAVGYVRGRRGLAAAWVPLLLAYLSHLVLDLVGPDHRPPFGIPLFWPFSDATFLSPVTLLAGFHHAGSTGASVREWLAGVFEVRNLLALGTEIAIFAPPVILVELWTRRRAASQTVPGRGRPRGLPGPR